MGLIEGIAGKGQGHRKREKLIETTIQLNYK